MKTKKLFAAILLCIIACFAFSLPASAYTYTALEVTDGAAVLASGDFITIDNSDGDTIAIPDGMTITITGSIADKTVPITLGSGASLIWEADVSGSGKISVSGGTGNVTIKECTISSSAQTPIDLRASMANITLDTVTFSGSDTSENAVYLYTTGNITIEDSSFTMTNSNEKNVLYLPNSGTQAITDTTVTANGGTAVFAGGDLTIDGSTTAITGVTGVYHTSNLLTIKAGTITGGAGGYGVMNYGGLSFLDGKIASTSSDYDESSSGSGDNDPSDAALYVLSSIDITIASGAEIDGGDAVGLKISGSGVEITDADIEGAIGIYMDTSPAGLEITGGSVTGEEYAIYSDSANGYIELSDCTVTGTNEGITTKSSLTVEDCQISITYTDTHSEGVAIDAYNDVLIKGESTQIRTNSAADEGYAIWFNALNKTLTIEDGIIYASEHAIYHSAGDIMITGGSLSSDGNGGNTGNSTVYSVSENADDVITFEDGSITCANFAAIQFAYDAASTLNITGGTITGLNAIFIESPYENEDEEYSVNISGGTLTSNSTDSGSPSSVVRIEGITLLTISGEAEIDGGTYNHGVDLNNGFTNDGIPRLTMTGGSVSGLNGIYGIDTLGAIEISGGTITSTAASGDYAAVNIGADTDVEISGTAIIDGDDVVGVKINNASATLEMTSGSVSGAQGINVTVADEVELSGGTITGTGGAAVYIDGDTDAIISGATLEGNTFGVYISDTAATLEMTSGSVSGDAAINIYESEKVEISGGTIGNGTYGIVTKKTPTTISGGDISGSLHGLNIDDCTVNITGGTFSGTSGTGIFYYSGTLNITPSISTAILVRGTNTALNENGNTPTYNNVLYSITSPNYNGSNQTANTHSITPFVNSSSFKFIRFLAGAPSYRVTVNGGTINGSISADLQADTTVNVTLTNRQFTHWEATGVTLSDPTRGNQTFTMPFNDVTLTAVYDLDGPTVGGSNPGSGSGSGSRPGSSSGNSPAPSVPSGSLPSANASTANEIDYILVIATLNKSGSVNSVETAQDIVKARNTALRRGFKKIYLKIPQNGTVMSAPTTETLLKAAGWAKLTLIYDYYDVKDARVITTIGNFLMPLNSNSGQIITGLHFGEKYTAQAENYIAKKWNKVVLGSFETIQKGGWGNTATISMSMDKLGFSAEEGTKLTAMIYDTMTNKWYQTSAVIENGNVVFKTKRTGVVTIVTEKIN
jgi:hypothetical protein